MTLVFVVKSEIGIPAIVLLVGETGEEMLLFCNRGFTKQNIVHPLFISSRAVKVSEKGLAKLQ